MSIESLIRNERLPAGFIETVDQIYRPISRSVANWHSGTPMLLGVNGGQGTGKSTLSLFLSWLLENEHGLKTAVISIDDLYLTRQERQKLATEIHPLLATRGVPGTHDIDLGLRVINGLRNAEAHETTEIPRFDKSLDDRHPPSQGSKMTGPAQVIILEGWCVGATPQEPGKLATPTNELEAHEDADGAWRRYVNDQLDAPYRGLFELIDRMVFLRAPDMAAIRRWRGSQEQKLRDRVTEQGGDLSLVMNDAALDRFINHYQRLTEHQWHDLAERADVMLQLGQNQRIESVHWKEDAP